MLTDREVQVRDIGSGNFGIARLMRDRVSDELIAVKYIERGEKVAPNFGVEYVERHTQSQLAVPA